MNARAAELDEINSQWQLTYGEDAREQKNALREKLLDRRRRLLTDEEQPLLEDLQRSGFRGSSVWDLVNTREAYPQLVAPLRDHASLDYLAPVREGIFRALTVRESDNSVLDVLIAEWRRGVGKDNKFLRWALANAITYIVPRKNVSDLVTLMDGDEYSNDPFVRRLRKSETGRKALAAKMESAKA